MASFNKIFIVGYLGKAPELRYTPQGTAVCNFSVATTERRKDVAGEMRDNTTWFRVTAWGRTAEICAEYLHKGSQAFIEGRLSQREYTDRDGNQRYTLEVNASDVQFLGPLGDRGEESSQREEGASAPPSSQSRSSKKDIEDDEIPF
jgi:single-strand DNA-binding protein